MDAGAILQNQRIVPVVVLEESGGAVELARTLYGEGIEAIEITLRTPAALDAIEAVAAAVPEMLLGAGSVRDPGQVSQALSAGARFLVSPGSAPGLLDAVDEAAVPFVPGAVTASEILALRERGYQLVKFFPAEAAGGLAVIRALAAPLPEARFFPTGGITAALAEAYLAHPQVACIGGSWFVPQDALAAGDMERIAALARAAHALTRAS